MSSCKIISSSVGFVNSCDNTIEESYSLREAKHNDLVCRQIKQVVNHIYVLYM